MNCFECKEIIVSEDSNLKCFLCNKRFHLSCLENLTKTDFEYISNSGANWKCTICDKQKAGRGDNTPLTPLGSKMFFEKTSDADSESSNRSSSNKELCNKCSKGFSHNAHKLTCLKCRFVFHLKCVTPPIKKEEYNKVKSAWVCILCKQAAGGRDELQPLSLDKNTADTADDSTGSINFTLGDIMNEILSFRKEIVKTNKEFTDSMNRYSEWMEDNSKKIDAATKKLIEVTTLIESLQQENSNLKKTVNELKLKVDYLEQALKENDIELQGVPFTENENLIEIVKNVSAAVGFEFQENMIDKVFRYKNNMGRPGTVMVRFVRNIDMQNLIEKRRLKRNLNSRDLGFMGGDAMPVYVNNSLTSEKRKLLNAAKQVKKDKLYTFLWVRNGRIFMRKNQGDRFVIVDTIEDLAKLS